MLHLVKVAPTEREPGRSHAREHAVLNRRAQLRTVASAAPVVTARPRRRLAIGQDLGERYRVTGFLGNGGMGAVYRVLDRVLDKEVALKCVCTEHISVREEVKLAQQVTHRNVCRTYDLETIDGQQYVKMEYISGESLGEHLARVGPLRIPRTLAILREIADALAAAHARGIVHCDLKPSNVMLDGDRVVVVDFGLAQHEGAHEIAGTPAYMAPEQLAGGVIDARTDWYALGCLAYEMLAGAPPYGDGPIGEVVGRRLMGPPFELRVRRPDVPRSIAAAVAALLSDDPAARPLGLRKLYYRERMSRVALAVCALAVTVGGIAGWTARPVRRWTPTIVDLPQYDENADDPSLSPDGASYVFSSDRGHRDMWSVYVASLAGGEPRQISPAGRLCVGGRWTRDGSAVLMSCYAGSERRIVRVPLDGRAGRDLGPGWVVDDCGDALAVVVARPTGAELVLRGRDGRDLDVAAMPGVALARCDRRGEHIVFLQGPIGHPGFGGDLVVTDRAGRTHELGVHGVESAAFTPDGEAIVFAMQQGGGTSLYEIRTAGGTVRALTPHEPYATSPDISSDGSAILYDRDRTSIPLFELTARGAEQKTFRYERLVHVVAAPDGKTVVATKQENDELTIVAISLDDFHERTLAAGEALFVSRAGQVVFRAADDPTRLAAVPLAGGAVATLATLPATILDAADGSDGVHVELDRDGAGEAWLVAPDGSARPEGVPGLVMPSPTGDWRAVRVTTGAQVTLRFVPPTAALSAPAFERAATWGQPAWVSDRELAYCELTACHRVDVATGRDVATTPIELPGNRPITVGTDGKHWYITSYVGQVTRHVITNFADRAWGGPR